MSVHKIDGKMPRQDVRAERIANGTIGADHIVNSSLGGNTATNIITPIDAGVLYYGGTWSVGFKQDVGNLLGMRSRNNTPGAYMTVQFSGTSIAIVGNTGPNFGRFDVYIDDILTSGSINTFTPLDANYFVSGGLDSENTSIALDDSVLFSGSGTVTIDGEDITYASNVADVISGGSRGANGTTAATHRAGTMVYQSSSMVEGYSLYRQTRIILWKKTNLAPGNHTMKIVLRSDKHASASDYYTEINGFVRGGILGAQNILTNLRYFTYGPVTSNAAGVIGPFSLTPADTNQQLLAVIGAYPTAVADTALVMFNPADNTYSIATNKASTANISVVLTALYLGPTF